jgi:hypothetical protein
MPGTPPLSPRLIPKPAGGPPPPWYDVAIDSDSDWDDDPDALRIRRHDRRDRDRPRPRSLSPSPVRAVRRRSDLPMAAPDGLLQALKGGINGGDASILGGTSPGNVLEMGITARVEGGPSPSAETPILNPLANPYYGRGYVTHSGNRQSRIFANAPVSPSAYNQELQPNAGAQSPAIQAAPRVSVHDRLSIPPGFLQSNQAPSASAFAGYAPANFPLMDPSLGFVPNGNGDGAPTSFADAAFVEGVLNPPGPGIDSTAQTLTNVTSTMNQFMATMGGQQQQMQAQISTLQAGVGSMGLNTPHVSLPMHAPTRPVAQYARPPPHFAPYVAAPQPTQTASAYVPLASVGTTVPPQNAFSQGPFAPQPNQYYDPFPPAPFGGPAPAGGMFPRTGYAPAQGQHNIPVRRLSTYAPNSTSPSDDFYSRSAS